MTDTPQEVLKVERRTESLERYADILEAIKALETGNEDKAIQAMLSVVRGLKQ